MDEKKLVEGIVAGDEAALRLYWRNFGPRVLSFVEKRVANKEDAEEIVQDTFLASLESLRDFDYRASLATFIRSIAQHKTIDYYRRKKIKQVLLSQLPEDIYPLLSQFVGPEEEFDLREIREKIQLVFNKIRPLYKTILIMKYFEGRTVVEIAKELAVTMKSAESSLFRARMEFVKVYKTT